MTFMFATSRRRGRHTRVVPPAGPALPAPDYIAMEQYEVTRDFYHRSAYVLWDNVGGDWYDSLGVAQGTTPYVQGGGSAGLVSLDVSAMLSNWTGITLRASGNFARMHSLLGATPPKLVVDGVDIAPYANIEVSTSTSGNLDDGRLQLTAQTNSNILLDFDIPSGAVSATLVVNQSGGTGQFKVYRTASPVLNAWSTGTKVYGIGQNQTIAALKNHASVIAAWEWTANWTSEYSFATTGFGGLRAYKTINGEGWAGMYFRAAAVCGETGTTSTPANVRYEFKSIPATIDPFRVGGGGIDHCFMQYEIISRFNIPISDSMLQGGKFPGFDGRYGVLEPSGSPTRWDPVYGNGGAIGYGVFMPNGNTHIGGNRTAPIMAGWSARGQWKAQESPDGPLQDAVTLGSYLYHPGYAISGTGDVQMWDNVVLMPNVQHTVEHELKINSVINADADGNGTGVADGIHRIWVDGVLVRERTDFIWTKNAYMNINAAWLTFQHGGLDAQCSEQDFDWGPIVIATEYIGPRDKVPTWRAGLTQHVWAQVGTNTIKDIDPIDDAAHNPNGAGVTPPWGPTINSQTAIVDAWGGGILDTDKERFVVWGGGHGDYQGNESYVLDLSQNSPAWVMPRPPSGSLQYEPSFNPQAGAENEPTPAGQPRSAHSYGKMAYIPTSSSMEGAGKAILVATKNNSPGGQSSDPRTYLLNIDTGVFENKGDLGVLIAAHPSAKYIAPIDSVLNIGDDSLRMTRFSGNPLINTDLPWSSLPGIPSSGLPPPMYLDTKGVIAILYAQSGTFVVALVDPNDLSDYVGYATISATNAPTPNTHTGGAGLGATWVSGEGKIYCWDNFAGNLDKVWRLTPPAGNVYTDTWTWDILTVSGLTGARGNNGTYGRLQYSDKYNCLYLLNDTREKLWVLSLGAV